MQLISTFQRQRFAATRSILIGNQWPTFDWPEIKVNFIRSVPVSSVSVARRISQPKTKNPSSLIRKITSFLSLAVLVVALIAATIVFGPNLYHQIVPVETVPIISQETGSPIGGNFDQGTAAVQTETKYLPQQDSTLPAGEWVIIPRIGVRTQLLKTETPDPALEKGVWWVPDFGQPGDEDKPMILAAHRFGYKWWWQNDYWKYHSFYLLPELEPGDTVEIIADQRKWTYEIYAGEEGEEITDYQADLILYTCKYLKDTVRYFRYARLVNPEVSTQQVSALNK
jgi:sortase (surface protein transpeptidase)